jgi:outer membrane protein assembly factor BamD
MKRLFLITLLLVATVYAAGCGTTKPQRKEPAQLYKEGVEKLEGKNSIFTDYEGAEGAFEEIKRRYSFTSFAPLAELRLADINFEREEYQDAISNYDEFIKMHPGHKEVPNAIYKKGLSYFKQIGGKDSRC